MAFPSGTKLVPWTDEEFDLLQHTILEEVSNGGTVVDACQRFSEMTNFLRSPQSARFKFQTVLRPRCEIEYLQAQDKGREALAQRALEGSRKPVRGTIAKLVSAQTKHGDDDNEPRMTQRELIKFLRTVNIVDEDAERLQRELDAVRSELQQVVRERDELKHKNLLLQKQYEEAQAELEPLLNAFNLARKHVTKAPEPSRSRITVGPNGEVQKVEVDE